MSTPSIDVTFRDLVARGLLASTPPQAIASGNADRRPEQARTSWRATRPDGTTVKLTLAASLDRLPQSHAALASACPAIIPRPCFHERVNGGEVLAEEFFAGTPLDEAVRANLYPTESILAALGTVSRALAATEQPSNEAARQAEWQQWTEELLALPGWRQDERALLTSVLLPALYSALATTPATARWSNGDFLPSNLLVGDNGGVRLIDAEFARRTHFFAEDAVRFRVLSSLLRERPDLDLPHALPASPGLVWHLYFWLRQWQLEATHNTAEYLERVRPARLGLIRCLAEQLMDVRLTAWSAPSAAANHFLESVRLLPDSGGYVQVTGWFVPPIESCVHYISARSPWPRTLDRGEPSLRPDVQAHFADNPRALRSGFRLHLDPGNRDFPVILCAETDHGTLLPFARLNAGDLPPCIDRWSGYTSWAAEHDPNPPPLTPSPASNLLFSILLPAYRPAPSTFLACLDSVRAQHHTQWELCLVDDASEVAEISQIIRTAAEQDQRIRVNVRAQNGGISRATNDALAMSRGDYIVLLDHDDLLRPHTLFEFASFIRQTPELDVLYSDEDKINADGQRKVPFLKPGFSPEFLRGVMYAGHALCVRTSLARALGGMDSTYDGVQDFEFMLRLSERTSQIGHVPKILYHWRQSPASSALHGNAKGDMDRRQAEAVQAHLIRIGDGRRAIPSGGHRVRLEAVDAPPHEVVAAATPDELVARLIACARQSLAEVIVWHPSGAQWENPGRIADLTALASRPDSGCVSPILLDQTGLVLESGRIGARPLLRGCHPQDDGYHGSLRCNREVDELTPTCIAIRRSLLLSFPASLSQWTEFCSRLRRAGLYHRVCASTAIRVRESQLTNVTSSNHDALARPEFYNPQFSKTGADYSLPVSAPSPRGGPPQIRLHIEQPETWHKLPQYLIVRGWVFSESGVPIRAIRLRLGHDVWPGVTGLPRPDVHAAYPGIAGQFSGFEIRGHLPPGRNHIQIEILSGDFIWHPIHDREGSVRRKLASWIPGCVTSAQLLAFQLPAHANHPPRKVRPEKFPFPSAKLPLPHLALVTPSYNQARFLPETMRSVLEQPGVSVDYVVQDGGSSDDSVGIIRRVAAEAGDWRPENEIQNPEYKNQGVIASDFPPTSSSPPPAPHPLPASRIPSPASRAPRLIAWESTHDNGQADAIVRAFAKTSGAPDDLMAWINSDDFYLPGTLGFVADYFARRPDVDVLYGHRVLVDENSQEIGRWFLPKHDPEVLRLNDFVPQETMFWRRRIWDKVGGIDPSFKFAMDWDLLLRFQAAGAKIVRVPYFLACFRIHSAQKTSAQMQSVGQAEITRLRERTFGRPFPPAELETNPTLLRYLRRSAFIEFLWKLGIRAP